MSPDLIKMVLDGINRIEDKCDKIVSRVSDLEKNQAISQERQKVHAEDMQETSKEVHEIRKILAGQHEQLVDHVQRSNNLQLQQDAFKNTMSQMVDTLKTLDNRIERIEEKSSMIAVIEQYEVTKKERFIAKLKNWKIILGFLLTTSAFISGIVGYLKGWFN